MFHSDKLVRVWDLVEFESDDGAEVTRSFKLKPFGPLEGHKYSVNFVEFSPCGGMLLSCSLDGTTIIWDAVVRLFTFHKKKLALLAPAYIIY